MEQKIFITHSYVQSSWTEEANEGHLNDELDGVIK